MKKLLCMLLCLLLAMAVLAGCTGPATDPSDDSTQGDITVSDEGVHYDADGNLVVPKHEGVTLTIGIPESVYVLDYEDNYYTQWLEEKTGMEITIKKYATESSMHKQQLATDTAGGNGLPDILFGFNLGSDLIDQYGEEGYIIDLSDYVNNKSKSAIFWENLEKLRTDPNGDWGQLADKTLLMMHSDNRTGGEGEGAIYGMPDLTTSLVDYLDFYPWINTKWLDVVKMDMPKTLDDLVAVLRAFKNTDCNGNGTADEIPMLGSKTGELGADVVAYLMNFFVYYNDAYMFNIDDSGKLYLPCSTDAYKDAMEFINGLIDEGLLNTKSLTSKIATTNNMLSNGDFVGVTLGQPTLIFQGNARYEDYAIMDLFGNAYYNPDELAVKMFITEDCEDVNAAYDLLMLIYTWESAVIQRYGEKGVDWDVPAEGTMSAMGLPATVTAINDLWAVPTNKHWGALMSFTTYDVFDLIDTSANPYQHAKWQKFKEGTDAYKKAYEKTLATIGEEKICPWLRFNEEEHDMAPARESLKKEIESWRSKFILGEKDAKNASDWAEYMAVLERAGLQAYIDAANVCYNRMYPNGHVNN